MRNVLAVIAAIVIVGGLLWLFTKQGNVGNFQSVIQPTTSSSPQTTQPSPSITSQFSKEEKEIKVEAYEFRFEPATINLTKGQKVKIMFKNEGKFPHNLTIPDLQVATKTIQPDQSDEIEFTPDKSGTFSFMCTVDQHAQKGMKGSVTIK